MPSTSGPAPFRWRDGQLWLEDVRLGELAQSLEGRAAWLLSHRAVTGALRRVLRVAGGPASLAVGMVGPREVLALAAQAGCWARVASMHELALARSAGFPVERIAVRAPILEDGLLRDALTAGVAVLEAQAEEARNVERLASALGHALPASSGAPPDLLPGALRRVGGLLAPALAGAPELALDAAWDPRGRARVVVVAVGGPAESSADGSVRGLPGVVAPARLIGAAGRGDWVLLPDPRAAGLHRPDPAHPLPLEVMVKGSAWRILEPRPWPAS
jgi:hypothetical protein